MWNGCLPVPQVASDAAARLGPAVSAIFSAATFLKFERDAAGAISLPLLLQYLARRVANSRLVREALVSTQKCTLTDDDRDACAGTVYMFVCFQQIVWYAFLL
jgi:hypothetical protein